MGRGQYALSFLAPTVIASSDMAPGHPAAAVLAATKFRRTAETVDATGTKTIDFDLGAGHAAVTTIFLNETNAGSVSFQQSTSSDLSSPSTVVSAQAPPIDARVRSAAAIAGTDKPWGRGRKGLLTLSAALTQRYGRLNLSTPDDGASTLWVGAILFVPSLTTLTLDWTEAYRWSAPPALERSRYPGAGFETQRHGPKALRYDLAVTRRNNPLSLEELSMLQGADSGNPILLYENRGTLAHAYLMELTGSPDFADAGPTFDATGWAFEELL